MSTNLFRRSLRACRTSGRDHRLARTNLEHPAPFHRRWIPVATCAGVAAVMVFGIGDAAHAAGPDGPVVLAVENLQGVISNLRLWLIGILAALATLFLTIGAVRYLAAGGDPGEVERAKGSLKSAAIGYALALLAPILVTLVAQLVG